MEKAERYDWVTPGIFDEELESIMRERFEETREGPFAKKDKDDA